MVRFLAGSAAVSALLVATTGHADEASSAPACVAWDVEYTLSATVRISDTTMGAGDGTHVIGPGKAVLRFEDKNGEPSGAVKVLEYRMRDRFDIATSVLFTTTKVAVDTTTVATPNACGVAAEGILSGTTLRWSGTWKGIRTDGNVTCNGGFCGKFGAPPNGTSPTHVAPHDVIFAPFEYGQDKKTFTMGWAVVSRLTSPSQTSRLSLGGREVRRTCVKELPAPKPGCSTPAAGGATP